MDIKPIETFYNGYRFRSRLEARWAVFFDSLGVDYEYEPEGFVLPSGKMYLPDFRVKCWGTRGLPEVFRDPFTLYVEVKGEMTEEDEEKIREFYEAGHPILVVGPIPPARSRYGLGGCDSGRFKSYDQMDGRNIFPFNYETIDGDHFACYPTSCEGKFYLMGDDCNYIDTDGVFMMEYALDKARQARFEHGEAGL